MLIDGSSPEQLADVDVTKNGYDPIDGTSAIGLTSGWKVRHPTVVIADAGGANVTAKVRFDDNGRAVESREAGSTGTDAGTKLTAFYSAGPNAQKAECDNKPGYAGRACMTYLAGPATGHDPARMATGLPVKTITAYNRYGSVASVTESATGPVAGAMVTQTRTTTSTYDDADRVTSVQISADGAGATASPVAKSVDKLGSKKTRMGTYDRDLRRVRP